jgi:hypothetical protein
LRRAAIMGESKPKSFDEIPSRSKPIEGVGTSVANGGGSGPEIPVVVVVVLVIVTAIGSGFGLMRARKAHAARKRGAEGNGPTTPTATT